MSRPIFRAPLTSAVLLSAYQQGLFPMADDATSVIRWYDPEPRAIIPLERVHLSRRLLRTIRQAPFEIRTDTQFHAVMEACMPPRYAGDGSWISLQMIDAYTELHHLGFAHSVETWLAGQLVGGLYGVTIGGLFAGESMFHTITDASKVAFAHLVERLRRGGFVLLDTQMLTPLTLSFGAIEISRLAYKRLLAQALRVKGEWLVE